MDQLDNEGGYSSVDPAGNMIAVNQPIMYSPQKVSRRSKKRSLLPDEELLHEQLLHRTRIYSEQVNAVMSIDVIKRGLKVFIRA